MKYLIILAIFVYSNCVVSLKEQRHFSLTEKFISGTGEKKVLLLSIDGIITSFSTKNFVMEQQSTVSQIVGKLNKAAKDKNIKAIILKINSPGGTVTSSNIIYQALIDFKKEKQIPIVSIFLDTATSGAYYIASSSDYIVANPTSITGSIGVIIKSVNLQKTIEKMGIKNQTITSGKNKALNDPLSTPNDEHQKILQEIVQQMYENFVSVVKINRKNKLDLKQEDILFDGRIFTSQQAKNLGLIDEIGYFKDVVAWLEKKLSIENFKLITYTYKTGSFNNIYEIQEKVSNQNLLNQLFNSKLQNKILYLWEF